MTLADLFLFAGLVALGSIMAWLATKVRDHRRMLDRRIDTLAEESRERSQSLGRSLHELADRVEKMERLQRVESLASLVATAARSGRISESAVRGLDESVRGLRLDVRSGDE